MTDIFSNRSTDLNDPANDGFVVVPSDAEDLPFVTRGIYVGTSGNLVVQLRNGTQLTFNSVAAGVVQPLRVKRVLATGTTAAGIIGLY